MANITINNGVGTSNIVNGTYNVTASVLGYDNTSISPSSLSIEEGTNTYNLTISATGTLTIHVTEDGTSSGTPVVGATFKRADSLGNQYGSLITTNTSGDAVLPNVLFVETNAPTIYYVQLSSDGSHDFNTSVMSTTMTSSSNTVEVTNTLSPLRTFNMYDANYENLVIESGNISLE